MSQHLPHRKQPPPKLTKYAGPTTCLRCDDVFVSWDRRQNRLCPHCRNTIDTQPADEPSYPIALPKRRFRNADDG